MVKEQFRETNISNEIKNVVFTIDSRIDIIRQASVEVTSKHLYVDSMRNPIQYGSLDRRMGVSSMGNQCATCGKKLSDCMGHFGYMELALPVFHIGYFKCIIQILQTICKTCAHVMLTPTEKSYYLPKAQHPKLTYLERKALHKRIWERARKKTECPYCKQNNGSVKRNGFLKIVHERYKNLKEKDPIIQEKLSEFSATMERDKEFRNLVQQNYRTILDETLNPIMVKELFSRIPDGDVYLLLMNPHLGSPQDLILTNIPVPPACIRPSVVSHLKSGTNEDYLTVKLSEIALINDVIRKSSNTVSSQSYMEHWDFLQLHCALYINSEISGIPLHMQPKRTGRGIVQRLKGKQGRFRGNLSGKRVDFTARTVISPDPNLRIEQVSVPIHVAMTLTYPELVYPANIELMRQLIKNGTDVYPGANFVRYKNSKDGKRYLKYGDRKKIAEQLQFGDIVERHLRDDDVVLFNRQPSLHKQSIMALRVKVSSIHRTFRFNECVCTPYNADFDGDEMNVHLPQTEEAKAEALILLANKSNMISSRNGELLIAAIQDFIYGAFALTHKDIFLNYAEISKIIISLNAFWNDDIPIIPKPAILKPVKLWTGKQAFNMIMKPNAQCPIKINLQTRNKSYSSNNKEFCINDSYIIIRNSELLAGMMDKSVLGSGSKQNIFYVALRDYSEEAATKIMWCLGRLTTTFNIMKGVSLGADDVRANENFVRAKEKLLDIHYLKCNQYVKMKESGHLICQPGRSEEETLEHKILNELSVIRDNTGKICVKELHPLNSGMNMAICGSKGSFINMSQMVGCVGQQAINGHRVEEEFDERTLLQYPWGTNTPQAKGFVQNSFQSGLDTAEYIFHSMSGREGLTDTAVKTADTGYMQRRLVKNLEDLSIKYDMTVRNSMQDIIQISYGTDGLDPSYMEDKNCPIDYERLYYHIRAILPCKNEESLDGARMIDITNEILNSEEYNCLPEKFKMELTTFLMSIAKKITHYRQNIKTHIVAQLERLTASQLEKFIHTCKERYMKAMIEPGTAVGAIAAQSIGEPGTQMTLKTFHFAGIASMNITQGVPRIKEIINASPKIHTPIITTTLTNESQSFVERVKARIKKRTLKDVVKYNQEARICGEYVLIIKLNIEKIKLLQLEVDANSISYAICTSRLKLTPKNIQIVSNSHIIIRPNIQKEHITNLFYKLKNTLPKIIVKGLPSISRVIEDTENVNGKLIRKLFIEGDNFREVMATSGIFGEKTTSNNIIEVFRTLGIEAARTTIMKEIKSVMEDHGIFLDERHQLLLADLMTCKGEVYGITRQGLAKMKESVLNLASFERTSDHLFEAAYYGQKDIICGVSESIIMGIPIPVGSGSFKLLHKADKDEPIKKELLFDIPECH